MINTALLAFSLIIAASGPLFAHNGQTRMATGATMATSNVYYDLMSIYGEDVFDPVNPEFDGVERIYDTFKFYAIKPYENDAYLYAYFAWPEGRADDYQWSVKYSTSTTTDEEGAIVESYHVAALEYINHYGYTNRYVKYRINDIFDVINEESFRLRIESIGTGGIFEGPITPQTLITINYAYTPYTSRYDIEHEISFRYDETDDIVYNYFGTEYVTITEKAVGLHLIGYDEVHSSQLPALINGYKKYFEQTYCFFDTDKDIDQIIEVEYVYQMIEYEFTYRQKIFALWDGASTLNEQAYALAYDGTYLNFDPQKYYTYNDAFRNGVYTLVNESSHRAVLASEKQTIERMTPFFFGWLQYGWTYEFNTIVDLSQTDGIADETFKTFLDDGKQKEDGTSYQWAFEIANSDRTLEVVNRGWSWFTDNWDEITTCHEVKQAMILRLKYESDDQVFDLNAWDEPTDTSFVIRTTPPIDIELGPEAPDWLKTLTDLLNNLFQNFTKYLIIFGAIVLSLLIAGLLLKFKRPKVVIKGQKNSKGGDYHPWPTSAKQSKNKLRLK